MSAIKVSIRIRPFTSSEASRNEDTILSQSSPSSISIVSPSLPSDLKHFSVDHCYWSGLKNVHDSGLEFTPKNSSQEEIFEDLGTELLSHSILGYNTCIFAYGQTGSGKSFTMMGNPDPPENIGLIPRICTTLFQNLSTPKPPDSEGDTPIPTKYSVSISYYEIYNERVFDLLSTSSTTPQSLKIREHPSLGPYIVDLASLVVDSVDSILKLLEFGNKRRSTAGTNMNEQSSRSHAVFTILLTQEFSSSNGEGGTSRKVSKISLVDLAGSERANATGATGVRLKEGGSINKSLAALGNVIYALGENSEKHANNPNPKRLSKRNSLSNIKSKMVHVPYRDSVLTYLLKDSLGGSSKTYMIATLSPSPIHYEESLSTLRFVDRVKKVINNSKINETKSVEEIVKDLKEEVKKLREKVLHYESHSGVEENEDMKKIAVRESWSPSTAKFNHVHRKSIDPGSLQHLRRNSRPDSGGFSGFANGRVSRNQSGTPTNLEDEESLRSMSPTESVSALLDQLNASEKLISEMNESFEEKLRKTHQYYLEKLDSSSTLDPEAVNSLIDSSNIPDASIQSNHTSTATLNQSRPSSPFSQNQLNLNLKSFSDSEVYINSPPPSTTATSEDYEMNKNDYQERRRRRSYIVHSGGDDTVIDTGMVDFRTKKSQFIDNLRDLNGEQQIISATTTYARPFGQVRQDNYSNNGKLQQRPSIVFQKQDQNNVSGGSMEAGKQDNFPQDDQQLGDSSQFPGAHQPPHQSGLHRKSKSVSGRNNRVSRSQSQIYQHRKSLKFFTQPFTSLMSFSSQTPQLQYQQQPEPEDTIITPTPALIKAVNKWKSRNIVSKTQKLLRDVSKLVKEANIISLELKSNVLYLPAVFSDPVPVSFWEGVAVKDSFSNVFSALLTTRTSADDTLDHSQTDKVEVYIKLLDGKNNSVYYWTVEELTKRLENMRKLYNYVDSPNEFLKQRQLSSQSQSVFYSNANSTPYFEMVGASSVLLKNILWGQSREFRVPVVNSDEGSTKGYIQVVVTPISTLIVDSGSEEVDENESIFKEEGSDGVKGKWDDIKSEGVGLELHSELIFEVSIVEIVGINPAEYTQIHGQFRVYDEQNQVERVYSTDPLSEFKSNGVLKFGYCQSIKLRVTEGVQKMVKSGVLKIEVFGRRVKSVKQLISEELSESVAGRNSAFSKDTNHSTDSSPEVLSSGQLPDSNGIKDFAKRKKYDLVFQVQMLELSNSTGTFKFVPVQSLTPQSTPKNAPGELFSMNNSSSSSVNGVSTVKSYLDTGTFLIRQGLQRKITIKIIQASEETESNSLLNLLSVSAIRIGNIRRIDEEYITSEANRFATANETEGFGDSVMLNIPIMESRISTLPDGRSVLEVEFPWDSSVHNSPFLNQVTKQQSRIDVTIEIDMKIMSPSSSATFSSVLSPDSPTSPTPFSKTITTMTITQNTSFIIFDRDFKLKPILKSGLLKLLLAKHINGRMVKYTTFKSFLYRAEFDVVYARKLLRPLWDEIDCRRDYIRGEEILNGWRVKGQELVLDFLERRQKLRWREDVEVWRQRVEEDELVPNESGEMSLVGLAETKQANVPVIVVMRGTPSPNIFKNSEDDNNKKDNMVLLRKIVELWRQPTIKDFGFEPLLTTPNKESILSPVYQRHLSQQEFEWKTTVNRITTLGPSSKRGWLNCPQPITNNWMRKWFVIRRPYLFVYDNNEECDELIILNLSDVVLQYNQHLDNILQCLVAFPSPEQQREHYRCDWHRYNLKRKVADLPPVSADQFVARVQTLQSKMQKEQEKLSFECSTCKKSYSSNNAYDNHLASAKHKDKVSASASRSVKPAQNSETVLPHDVPDVRDSMEEVDELDISSQIHQFDNQFKKRIQSAKSEKELMDLFNEKMEKVPRLSPEDCLFCNVKSPDMDANFHHMTVEHSFFLPNLEYVSDLPGLLNYLQTKVAVANICLFCNGKGRTMHSLEAVRKHMSDKGHCKIFIDEEEDDGELDEYYDYEQNWETVEGDDGDDEWEEINEDIDMEEDDDEDVQVTTVSTYGKMKDRNITSIEVTDDQVEMQLPSGARIGSRQYKRYWKQHLPATRKTADNNVIKSLLIQYKLLGHATPQMILAERKEKERQNKMIEFKRKEAGARIGQKGNMFLMKFFRRQNPI
ncbi:hypothetical protein HK098_003642 [Nowakowskiella sp. JEL0407]|nr:hypothetical protein HK098_003642 [Nowakowskiella sp. JEL0407]